MIKKPEWFNTIIKQLPEKYQATAYSFIQQIGEKYNLRFKK